VGRIDRKAAAIRQSEMPTIYFSLRVLCSKSVWDQCTHMYTCTFYFTTTTMIMASMPHTNTSPWSFSLCVCIYVAILHLLGRWCGQRLAGAGVLTKTPSTQSACILFPLLHFFFWLVEVKMDQVSHSTMPKGIARSLSFKLQLLLASIYYWR